MRRVVLYIAVSLDGYIADKAGKVDWLLGDGSEPNAPDDFLRFIETVDTVILGKNTYLQIVNELSPDSWAYPGKITYVLTHKKCADSEEIIFTDEPISELINRLKQQEGLSIWVCGGASIVNQLMQPELIDEIVLSIMPIVLGSGIRLFSEQQPSKLRLKSMSSANGIAMLSYEKR